MPKKRIACIIAVSTPYFQARFESAALAMQDAEIYAIEIGRYSETYAFTPNTELAHYKRLILAEAAAEVQKPRDIASRLARALGSINADAVAVPGWSGVASQVALRWCQSESVPAILMSESAFRDEPRRWIKERIKREIVKCCAAALVGGRLHSEYASQLGVPENRIFTGYDVVDNDYFRARTQQIRSSGRNLPEAQKLPERYYLASARFVEKKNLLGLIRAYGLYRQRVKANSWDLVIVGDGPMRPEIERLICDLQLQFHVHLPGFKQYDELPIYYAFASAFIHASTTEQWGLVVNEAMASGLPVLVSDRCGCVPELVREGVNGFTFSPADLEQTCGLMVRMMRSDLNKMGKASQEIISEYSPAAFAGGLQKAVKAALEVPQKTGGLLQPILLKALLARG